MIAVADEGCHDGRNIQRDAVVRRGELHLHITDGQGREAPPARLAVARCHGACRVTTPGRSTLTETRRWAGRAPRCLRSCMPRVPPLPAVVSRASVAA